MFILKLGRANGYAVGKFMWFKCSSLWIISLQYLYWFSS